MLVMLSARYARGVYQRSWPHSSDGRHGQTRRYFSNAGRRVTNRTIRPPYATRRLENPSKVLNCSWHYLGVVVHVSQRGVRDVLAYLHGKQENCWPFATRAPALGDLVVRSSSQSTWMPLTRFAAERISDHLRVALSTNATRDGAGLPPTLMSSRLFSSPLARIRIGTARRSAEGDLDLPDWPAFRHRLRESAAA